MNKGWDFLNLTKIILPNQTLYNRNFLTSETLHYHDSVEIFRVISGTATLITKDAKYFMTPGDVAIIPYGFTHQILCGDSTFGDIAFIPKQDFVPITRNYSNPFVIVTLKQIQQYDGLEAEIDSLFNKANYYYTNIAEHSFSLILANLLSVIFVITRTISPTISAHNKNWEIIQPIFNEISSNISNADFSLSYFAKKLNYSNEHLSRIFKEFSGTNFKNFLNNQRINEAKRLLIETNLDIVEIARLCGFNTIRSFNTRFKLIMNTTPSNYRNQFTDSKNTELFSESKA